MDCLQCIPLWRLLFQVFLLNQKTFWHRYLRRFFDASETVRIDSIRMFVNVVNYGDVMYLDA